MTMRFCLACALLFVLFVIHAHAGNGLRAVTPPTIVSVVTKKLAPGVTFTQEIDANPSLVIDVVTADLDAPGVHAEVGIAQDHVGGTDVTHGRETVTHYARRRHILVAVNGDYFPYTGDPLGMGAHAGELFSEPWMGNDGKSGPRSALGITGDGRRAVIDRLGFVGSLRTADGLNLTVNGLDRQVGTRNEIVVFTPLFGGNKVNRPGGTDVILTDVNLPVCANKRMTGTIAAVHTTADGVDTVPPSGLIISGGPGTGAAALLAHAHAGDTLSFVLGVGPVDSTTPLPQPLSPQGKGESADGSSDMIGSREVPTPTGAVYVHLPSRAGLGVDRAAWLWGSMREAVGGGPRLLTDGNVAIDSVPEGFDAGFVGYPNARTGVGISPDGHKLIIVTVDGRQSISQGVSLADLAAILKRYGAVDAMNLDGGGSTTMAAMGLTVDSPGGAGLQRAVADMLVIDSDRPYWPMPKWNVAPVPQPTPAGQGQETPLQPSPQAGREQESTPLPQPLSPPGKGEPDVAAESEPLSPQGNGDLKLTVATDGIEVGDVTRVQVTDGDKAADPSQVLWQGPVAAAVPSPPPQAPSSPTPGPASASGAEPPADTSIVASGSSPTGQVAGSAGSGAGTAAQPGPVSQPMSPPAAVDTMPIGFVDQRGYFTAMRPGVGTITALYHGQLLSLPVTVSAKPGTQTSITVIRASLSDFPGGAPNRSALSIHVVNGDGSPVSGAAVSIAVTGGAADAVQVSTDLDGSASVGITWDSSSGGLVTISAPGLSPVTLGQPSK